MDPTPNVTLNSLKVAGRNLGCAHAHLPNQISCEEQFESFPLLGRQRHPAQPSSLRQLGGGGGQYPDDAY